MDNGGLNEGDILRHSPLPMIRLDLDGTVVAAGRSWLEMMGRDAESVVGRPMAEFVPADHHDQFRSEFREVLAADGPVTVLGELLHGNGTRLMAEIDGCVVPAAAGRGPGVLVIMREITDQQELDRRRLARLQSIILNTTPIGVIGYDDDGTIVFSNPAAQRIAGLTSLDLHGFDLCDALVEVTDEGAPVPPARSRLCRVLIERHHDSGEIRLRHASGRIVPVEYHLQPRYEKGEYRGGVLSIADISTRLEDRAEIMRGEQELRHLFDNAPVALWREDFSEVKAFIEDLRRRGVTDFDRHFRENRDDLLGCIGRIRIIDVNRATLEMHRARTAEELTGDLSRTMTPESLEVFRQELVALANGSPGTEAATVLRTMDGEERHVLFRLFRDPGRDDWSQVYVAFMDMSEYRDLAQVTSRLRTAIDQTRDSVIITDIQGTIQYCNPAFEHVTGYSHDEVIGKNPRIIKSGHHDLKFYKSLWDTIMSGRAWHGHFVNRRKDGTIFNEEGSISPVFDTDGSIVNFVSVKRDVTHERELEARLAQSQKLEAVGQLAGGIAHDFNNILHAMMGSLEFAMDGDSSAETVAQELRQLRTNVDRAAELTRQLLAFSRRQLLTLRDIDPNDLVAQLLKMVRRVIGEDIRLDFQPGPIESLVHVDPGQIEQVLLNLCLNARDAMPDGGQLRIETALQDVDDEFVATYDWARKGRHVLIVVQDTGCGIAPEVLPQIFEPFFTTKDRGRGTGLGLATVYGTIKQHGGMVLVESEVGRGTTFKILLPTVAAETPTPADPVRSTPTARGGDETILLAEDDEAVRRVIQRILQRAGYHVITAADGEAALEVFSANADRIDLALLDLVMPGIGGPDVARAIRTTRPDVKILFNTGYSEEAIRGRAEIGRDAALIMKPHDPNDLLGRVRDLLDSVESN